MRTASRPRAAPASPRRPRHLGGQLGHEIVEGNAPFRLLAPAPVDADGAVDVLAADHENVGHLLELGPTDATAEGILRIDELDAEAFRLEPVTHGRGVHL